MALDHVPCSTCREKTFAGRSVDLDTVRDRLIGSVGVSVRKTFMERSGTVCLGSWDGRIRWRGLGWNMAACVLVGEIERGSGCPEYFVLSVHFFQFAFEALILACNGRFVCFEGIKLHL